MSDRSRERDRPDVGTASESAFGEDCLPGARSVLSGRYELGTCLRSSGTVRVCEAFDRDRQRKVVVHRLPVSALGDQSQDALLAQLRPLTEFRHPNVLPLVDAGIDQDELLLVCEPADGDSLADLLPASGPLDVETASGLAAQICDALSAAHRRGLRHGGLSPGRILITDSGDPLLLGFGWSDVAPATLEPTDGAEFTSPEQRGDVRAGDERSDLWSLGAVLCRATTGAAPPCAEPERIPEPFRRPVLRALADDPDLRMQSAAEFRAALEPSAVPERANALPTAAEERVWTGSARAPVAAAASNSNPFFGLVIAAGVLFVVTILALIAVPFGDAEAPIAEWLDRYAGRLIVAEVVLILVLGLLALMIDRRRTTRRLLRQRGAAGQVSKPAAARPE